MKILLKIFIILLFFGCNTVHNMTKNPPLVDLIVNQDKYSLILKHYFYKNFKTNDKNLAQFIIETNLTFSTSDVLSNNGKNDLKIVKGTVDFQIFNKSKTKLIKSSRISSSINTGSVSSLYGIDQNNDFAKERISKYLASKLYRKILLSINRRES